MSQRLCRHCPVLVTATACHRTPTEEGAGSEPVNVQVRILPVVFVALVAKRYTRRA